MSSQASALAAGMPGRWRRATPYAVSGVGHAILVLVVILATLRPERLPAPEQMIPVEILPAEPAAPAPAQAPPAPSAVPPPAPDAAAASPEAAAAAPQPWRRPTLMLSPSVKTDRALRRLESGEAIEQLCDLEAILQITRAEAAFAPDAVVAYAMEDVKVAPDLIVAEGAAVHNGGGWTALKFKCRFAKAPRRILAFEFRLGETIPRNEWSAHALPTSVRPLESDHAP